MSEVTPVAPPQPVPPVSGQTGQPAGSATPVSSTPATPPAAGAAPQQNGQTGGQQQPAPQPAAPVAGEAAQISAALRELARGGEIAAQVVARDNAALLVRTAAGATLVLNNLAAALQQANVAVLNATLKLQLNPANPQQATVTSANGTALQPPLAAQAQPPTTAQLALAVAPPQQGAAPAPPVLPQPGQRLAATVLPPQALLTPAPSAPASPSPMPTLPPGSQVQVVVQSVSLPNAPVSSALPNSASARTPPVPTPAPAVPASIAPVVAPPVSQTAPSLSSASLAAPAPAAPAPPTGSVQAAQTVARPAAPAPLPVAANTAAQSLPPGLPGNAVTGIVSGQGQPGQVLVSTPQGLLALQLPQPLPPGTQVSFELAALTRTPSPATTALGPVPLGGILTRLQGEWPVLQQTLDAVRAADPALAQRLQAELLPQANARLASTALQFMAAAAIGSAQAWLGAEVVRKLEQSGRGDLLRKLDDDFRELGRLNQRGGDNDWQALVLPMFIGGRVEPVQIFMRRRRDRKRQQQQTRFIIDFNLESTGPIQFDGFVSVRQLDLILRSEAEFGPAFRLDVTAIFTSALEITGMTGSIHFHDGEAPLAWPSPELDSSGPSTEVKA